MAMMMTRRIGQQVRIISKQAATSNARFISQSLRRAPTVALTIARSPALVSIWGDQPAFLRLAELAIRSRPIRSQSDRRPAAITIALTAHGGTGTRRGD